MADYDKIVRDRQGLIRRQMDARRIPVKQVQLDGGWASPSTILSYFPADADREPATMSVASLFRLLEAGALPADLLSLLMPDGYGIFPIPEGIDHDEFARGCHEFIAAKDLAHRADSPAGRDISDCEEDRLNQAAAALRIAS